MPLLPFWALSVVVVLLSMEDQRALGFHQKYLHLCSDDKWRSYRFGTTRGWVINDRMFFFGRTVPLKIIFWISLRSIKIKKYTFLRYPTSDCGWNAANEQDKTKARQIKLNRNSAVIIYNNSQKHILKKMSRRLPKTSKGIGSSTACQAICWAPLPIGVPTP